MKIWFFSYSTWRHKAQGGPGAEDLFDEEGEEEDAQDHPHGGAKGRAGLNQIGVETATGAQSETFEPDAGAGQRRGEGPD